MSDNPITVTKSSGNVFADLDLPNAEELDVKAQLTHRISVAIRDGGLTQVQAAKILGVDQPTVSALVRGRLDKFTTDRLLRFITALGNDVSIIVQPKEAARAAGVVRVVHDHDAARAALERAGQ